MITSNIDTKIISVSFVGKIEEGFGRIITACDFLLM
jgi:hypothetical protein